MAALARTGTGNVVFVVALGVSALGHAVVLASRADSEPRQLDNAAGWSADVDAVQIFDEPSAAQPPQAALGAPQSTVPAPVSVKTAKPRVTPPKHRPTVLRDIATPEARPDDAHDDAQSALADDDATPSPSPPSDTDVEEGVIMPRESWRVPSTKPHAPTLSGMPPVPSPTPSAAPEEARLAPGVARLETAFARSVPYYNYADPAWDQLPLGRVGSMKLTFVVDASGQILEATTSDSPPPVLERLRRRTLFGLRRGHFAITASQVTAGRRTLRIDVFLEQRPVGSQALPAMGFQAATNGRPGVATMHLESGRFVRVQVLPQDD